jgi:ATP-dependent DNA helicase DinG
MKHITDCFPATMTPRRGQLEALLRIEQSFGDGKKYFVYEGPTGAGKSAVAKTVLNWQQTGFITAPLNTLVSQYANDEKLAPLAEVRGKNTYQCRAFKRADYLPNCEQAEEAAGWKHHAERCSDYIPARNAFWQSNHSVTNLHFLYYSPVIEGAVWPRRVLVIDEAHKLESALIDMGRRTISPGVVAEVRAKLYEFPGKDDKELLETSAVEKWLRYFEDALHNEVQGADLEDEDRKRLDNLREGVNFTLQCEDWIAWLTTNKRLERVLHITPMSAIRAARKLFHGIDHVLFASATIGDKRIFLEGLGIKEQESGGHLASCGFRPENRPIFFGPKGSMSKQYGRRGLDAILQACVEVLEAHSEARGIIHCHSREVRDTLYHHLQSRFGARILTHDSKGDREAGIGRLRSSRNGVLCSIAMSEGIDLADDAARFCIFPKIPWPDMGDPYVKARMKRNPGWLGNQAALSVVQGSGRIVRNAEDHGATYIFDSSFGRLLRNAEFPQWWLDALRPGKKLPRNTGGLLPQPRRETL